MEYLQTENLVADSPRNGETEQHRMHMNDGKVNSLSLNHQTGLDYNKRLGTFVNWPHENVISHKKLAKAGFFYEGNGDEVQCYSCGVKVKDWKPSDIAVRKHQELFPNCNYIASIFNKASKRSDDRLVHNVLNSSSRVLEVFPASNVSSTETVPATARTTTNESLQTVQTRPVVSSSQNQSTYNVMSSGIGMVGFPDFEKMKSEEERLKTFEFGWPVESPKPCGLAREGFFYLLESDRVQCAFCRGIVSHWEPTDDPLREHVRHFAFCPFIMDRDVGNIPISKYPAPHSHGIDICGSSHWKNSGPENGAIPFHDKKIEKLENFGVKLHHGPKHPSQASKDARFRSFIGWPSSSAVQPKALVEAGFFYIGVQDYTRCFYCDGGLCNWEADDDPWEEHAKWFQHCAYVRLNKGDAWVEACLKKDCSPQKSILQQSISPQNPNIHVMANSPDIHSRVDELMNTSVVASVVELGIFPVDLVKAALMERIQTSGSNFNSGEDLYESVIKLQQERQSNTVSSGIMENIAENVEERTTMNSSETASNLLSNIPTTKPNVALPVEDTIKEHRLCKICMDKEIGVLFLPCGHLMSCVECGPAMTICPFCRQTIKGTVRAFLT